MLKEYKKAHEKAIIQYLTVDDKGNIIESEGNLFSNISSQNISDLHPFFESFHDLLPQPDQELVFSCIHLIAKNKPITADVTLKTFKKENFSVLKSEKKRNAIIIIQDLSSHYNSYQLTAQKRNESVINSQILELKNKYLKEKEDFKNTFIANFSHEIREPLSGISTFVEVLNKTNLNAEQKDYVNIISASSSHLKHMIEDILDISKIEAGKLSLIEESFNIVEFIDELAFEHQVKAKQKALVFEYQLDSRIPQNIIGDPYRLKQILNNLLDNALKYTAIGSVTFNVSLNQIRANKASIHFEITDTGIGIDKENFNTIFNSFTQLHQDQQNKGTGLGLAIVKNLIELMEGNISVDSALKKGSTFSFNLSFKIDQSTVPKTTPSYKIELKDSKLKYNVLLVEHSEITQLAVLKILALQRKFYLDIISNPEDVIPTIQNQNIDIILMDINLPNMSGDELAKKIRQLPEKAHKKIPIIALTGKVFPEDLKRYKKAKINDVVSKPFNEKSLLKAIQKYLK